MDNITVTLPKEVWEAFIFAGTNYKNRILYLEREGKISQYKLDKIKKTTLFNILKGIDIIGLRLCDKCKGTKVYEGKLCEHCK